jgi:hypothetical protein
MRDTSAISCEGQSQSAPLAPVSFAAETKGRMENPRWAHNKTIHSDSLDTIKGRGAVWKSFQVRWPG